LEIAGKQPGDPALAAGAIIRAVESKEPPLHLVLGADALERAHAKLERLLDELDQWKPVSLSTRFEKDQPVMART
ncbi:MAG TPA: hypothetical protein VFS35_10820, partial [Terrimicrobiaceae bacterium]|nr:hypothetical protein [Terrimicrobiaceae bacterium]